MLLEVSTNYGYVDYAKSLISEAKSWNSEIQNVIGVSTAWNNISELTSDEKSLLEKVVKTKFIESYSKEHKDDIGESTEGLAVINEVFSLSSSVLDTASTIEDYLEIMSTAFALVRMEDSLKAVVRQMLASCPYDETALSDALRDIVQMMDATKEELLMQLISKEVEIVGWNASKQLIDTFWSKGILKCNPEVQTLLAIYKTEKWLANYLGGVDDIVEAGANVTNFVVFENLMQDVVSTLEGNFSTNKSTDTANAYLSAVDIMFATWLKSCSTAVSFENSLDSGVITHWINLMNSNKGGSASTIAGAVKSYETKYISTYDLIWNGWIQNLEVDYPNSGLYEQYKDLRVDFLEKYKANSFVRKKIEIKCPVDVFVYDKSDNLVASVVAGDAWYDAPIKNITVVVEGDAKTLYLYDDIDYRIECVGTNTGLMDVIMTEYDDGSEVRNVYFYDLPLTDGKTFEMSVDDKILGDVDYELDSKVETLEPDLDTYTATSELYTLTVVSGAVNSDNEAIFEGRYYAGELIEVTALTNANQTFTGWTSNSYSVTFTDRTSKVTSFRMPAENVVVKAEISGHGYALYLDGNGGTAESVVVATNLEGKLDVMPTAVYAGYTLIGWYTAKEGGEEVTPSTVFSEDTIIYAHWTQNITPSEPTILTITFNANNGTVTPATMSTDEEGKLTELPTPVRSGYTFNGWYMPNGTRVDTSTVFTEDTTVKAQWSKSSAGEAPTTPNTPGQPDYNTGGNYTHSITLPSVTGGKVSANPASASIGSTVTITAIPDVGYGLVALTVSDSNGKALELTNKGDGQYSFKMPNSKVSIAATFQPIGADTSWNNPYIDISVGAWYYDAIKFANQNGLMDGVGNSSFAPNANLSRAMLAQILYNREGKPVVTANSPFTDVNWGTWYTDAVAWASAKGIVNGYGGGRFGPNNDITREQLAVMLWRDAGNPVATDKELHFSDAYKISDWAQDAVQWAVDQGILNGKGNGILDPTGKATRAETAQMLKNYLEK